MEQACYTNGDIQKLACILYIQLNDTNISGSNFDYLVFLNYPSHI